MSERIVVLPLGGIYSSAHEPVRLGKRLLVGHLNQATESALDAMAREAHQFRFIFTDEADWTEDYLAALEDGDFAAELRDGLAKDGSWLPLVAGVRCSDTRAEEECRQAAESLLGAARLLDVTEGRQWWGNGPWLLGGASRSYEPYCPAWGGGETAAVVVPLLSAGHVNEHPSRIYSARAEDVDVAELLDRPGGELLRHVAEVAGSPGKQLSHRLALACRLVHAESLVESVDVGTLLARQALDLLRPGGSRPVGAGDSTVEQLIQTLEETREAAIALATQHPTG